MSTAPGNCGPQTAGLYKRELGLLETFSIVISRIIGSGIFRTPGPIMALAASTWIFGFVWVLGGLTTVFAAVCYAELTAMMPKSGGPYVFLKEAYGPVWAFLRGWAMFFVSETGAIAAVSLVFAEYSSALWELLYGRQLPSPLIPAIALITLWLLTASNLFGVLLSGKLQNIFASAKIIALGAVIGTCFTAPGNFSNFINPSLPENFSWASVLAAGAALRYAFFAFSGWEGATYVAEEVKNPSKNLPLSLFLGISGVMILYAGANSAYLYQLPVEAISKSKWVATDAMKAAAGAAGGIFISAAVMMNTFGNISTQILCKARTWQAMAGDGLFIRKLSPLHGRYHTPNNALIAQGLWASALLILASLASSAYETIIDFFSATSTVFNIMTLFSLYLLRKKYPGAVRPYRAWLYPFSLVLILVIYSVFLLITLITAPLESAAGIGLTLTGLVYYYSVIKRRNSTGQVNKAPL